MRAEAHTALGGGGLGVRFLHGGGLGNLVIAGNRLRLLVQEDDRDHAEGRTIADAGGQAHGQGTPERHPGQPGQPWRTPCTGGQPAQGFRIFPVGRQVAARSRRPSEQFP